MSFTDYDKCALLLPMDGANNGTTFEDWSPNPKTITRNGASLPITSTAQSQFYGSSGYFHANATGESSHLRVTLTEAIGTDQFTIAAYGRLNDISAFMPVIELRCSEDYSNTSGNADTGALFYWRFTKIAWLWGAANTRYDGTITLDANTFYHFAATRDSSNVLRVFVNGIKDIEQTGYTHNISNVYSAIGGQPSSSTLAINSDRYLNDLLVVKGAALWTSNFIPPTRLIGEVTGNITDDVGSPAQRTVIAVPRGYPTKTFYAQSDIVSGNYTLQAPSTESHIIALDASTPPKVDLSAIATPV